MNSLKRFFKFFLQPKKFAQGAKKEYQIFFHIFFKLLFYKHTKQRIELLKEIKPIKPLKPITEELGFRKIDDLDPELLKNAHQAARNILAKLDLEKLHKESSNKHLVTFTVKEAYDRNHPIMKLAIDPGIIKMVGDYIGMLPVIENIMFWYSPNKENFESSSQFYHLDAQDTRTIQMLLFVEDIDENSGPFVLVDAASSDRLGAEVGYQKTGKFKRMSDELIESKTKESERHPLLGSAGSIFIADTDRCFHYGSRKAIKPRFILAFQYYSPYAFAAPMKWWNYLPFAKIPTMTTFTPTERLILGAEPQ